MKRLLLFCVVLILLALPSPAVRAEFIGGYTHSWINPQEINEMIGCFNDRFAFVEEEFLGNIFSADGFYFGLTSNLSWWDNSFKYEYLNISTTGAGEYNDEQFSLDASGIIHGICFELNRQLYRSIDLYGGIGYYWGSGDIDFIYKGDYSGYYPAGPAVQENGYSEYRSHYDLIFNGSPGCKFGAALHHPLGNGISFNAGIGYRYLVLEMENRLAELEGDSGPIFCQGEIPDELNADLSGLEITLGFSVAF